MKRLTGLEPAEVSLVARGANRKKFLVFKSEKGRSMPNANQEVRDLVASIPPEKMKKVEAIVKSMMEDDKDKVGKDKMGKDMEGPGQPEKTGLSERGGAALKAVARILTPFKDEITDDHLDAIQREIGLSTPEKTGEDGNTQAGEIQLSMDCPEGVDPEHHEAAMGATKKAYMDHMEKMGYQKYPSPQPEEGGAGPVGKDADGDDDEGDDQDDVEKNKGGAVGKSAVAKTDLSAFSKEQRGQLELVFKSNEELVKKNADLEKELKYERDQRVMKEFQEKAKTFKHLGANTDELATVLKSLSETDAESFKKVESILKSADEQISKGDLFKEYGSRIAKSGGGNSESQLNALVDSVVQKSSGGKTRAQIYDEVCQTPEGKKLLAESIRESQGV